MPGSGGGPLRARGLQRCQAVGEAHLGHEGYRSPGQLGRELCLCETVAGDCPEVTGATEVPGSGGGHLGHMEHGGARQWGRPT